MKKLLLSLLYLPFFFVLSGLFARSVLAAACVGSSCYPTIQEAVDVANTGDTITIQNGTYTDPVIISKSITIFGEDKNLTIVQTGASNIGFSLLAGADNVVIKNLKLTGNGEGINASGVSNLVLQDLIVSDNFFNTSGIYLSQVTTANIIGSTFTNNIIDIDLVNLTSNITISNSNFTNGVSTTYFISNDTSSDVVATDNNSWGTFDGNTIKTYLFGPVIFDDIPPTVDAGQDKFANASFIQNATGSDVYGVDSYLWEQISGPGLTSFDNPAAEDPIITPDTEGTYTFQLTVTDTSGNTNTDTFQLVWDVTPPQLTSAQTQDRDHDGQIDALLLAFDENIDDSRLNLGNADGWDVAGYAGESIGTGATANDNKLFLTFNESGTPDTAATPDVTYTSTQSLNSTHDLAGNELQDVTKTSVDMAQPAVISAKTQDNDADGQLDAIKVQFSEVIDDTKLVNEILHWTVNGYILSSVDTGTTTNDEVLMLRLNELSNNDTGALPDIGYSRIGGNTSVHDLAPASNELVDGTWATIDVAAPKAAWTSPASGTTISGTATLVISAIDEDVTKIKSIVYEYKKNDGLDVFHVTTDVWDTTPLTLGEYIVRATVTDNAGNITQVSRTFYVAAVITGFTHFTVDTNRIRIDWITDRPTDGRVVYDVNSHSRIDANNFPNYGYAFSTGTLGYGTNHSMIIAGLSDNTIYYFRVVSAGTPVVISQQGSNRTFAVTGAGGGGGGGTGGGGTPTSNIPPAIPPAPAAIAGQVAGVETEITPTPLPSPTPIVERTSTELPSFNWWLVIVPSFLFLFLLLLWLARRR